MSDNDALREAVAKAIMQVLFDSHKPASQPLAEAGDELANAALAIARPLIEAPLRAEIDRLRAVLAEHHRWHQEIGTVKVPTNGEDGRHAEVELDLSGEYADSSLCTRTSQALCPEHEYYGAEDGRFRCVVCDMPELGRAPSREEPT